MDQPLHDRIGPLDEDDGEEDNDEMDVHHSSVDGVVEDDPDTLLSLLRVKGMLHRKMVEGEDVSLETWLLQLQRRQQRTD